MKEPDNFACHRIHAGDIRALVTIAVNACQCQVIGDRATFVLAGDHMVDLKGRRMKLRWHPAVFASAPGALADELVKIRVQPEPET